MQQFVSIPSTDTLTNSRQELLNNDCTIMSNSSGTSFPTTNLQQGMFCYRTDLYQLYQLKDLTPTWMMVFDLTQVATNKAYVDNQISTLAASTVATSQVVTTAMANKILQLNASGQLPASVTGTAAGAPWSGITGTPSTFTPPIATATALGGVKQGTNVTIAADGTISVGAGIPSGVICMWSGSSASIPSGWILCNGSNGTPDLRNRFVVGATSTYAVGATGGEATHTLTVAEMPSHVHSGSPNAMGSGMSSGSELQLTNTGSAGGGGAHNNMPPYYALCFIMKQ